MKSLAASKIALNTMMRELIGGYGAFLFFDRMAPNLLLVAATLTVPRVGLLGLVSGLSTLITRRFLNLRPIAGGMDGLNGMLAGLFLGVAFVPDWKLVLLAVMAGPLTVLLASWLGEMLTRARLPLLSGAFAGVGIVLFALGRALALPHAPAATPFVPEWLPQMLGDFFIMLGAIYLSPAVTAGALVAAAIALSSRTLLLFAVEAFIIARVVLWALGVPPSGYAGTSVAAAATLVAIMTGGIFARPSARTFAVAGFGALCVCLVSLAAQNAMWFVALPALSLPYLVTTWLVMMALKREQGGAWANYWLAYPALPERALEQRRQAEARGLAEDSIALSAPFTGRWTVYQGVDGPHTHVPPRQHALDFHRLVEGCAFRGEGMRLEDYYAFDQPVFSPVHGWAVACRADLPDNAPGEVNVAECWGNYVLIALATGDYVLLAHLRHGSVRVGMGSMVTPGQEIARCGNSGRSPTPHLHMHVQTTALLGSPTRKFHLSGVVATAAGARENEGTFSLDCIPAAGDEVRAPSPNAALARGLHWPVGRRLAYRAVLAGGRETSVEIEVALDSNGTFLLKGANDASIAFAETFCLIALYGRTGGCDPLLDGLALALGVTPFAEGALSWRDVPPLRLLPAPFAVKALCWLVPPLSSTESRYERRWHAETGLWHQTGRHNITFAGMELWSCRTDANLAPELGLVSLAMTRNGNKSAQIEARLNGIGMRGDQGIPAWLSSW